MSKRRAVSENIKGVGERPTWDDINSPYDHGFQTRQLWAMHWAAQALDNKDLKEYALQYAEGYLSLDRETFGILEDWNFQGVGKTAWLIVSENAPLPKDSFNYLNKRLEDLYLKAVDQQEEKEQERKKKEEEKNNAEKLSARERENRRAMKAWGDIDYLLFEECVVDDGRKKARLDKEPDAAYKILRSYGLKKYSLEWIISKLEDRLKELTDIDKDEQLAEAYSNLTKKDIKNRRRWVSRVLNDAKNMIANQSTQRKPKKNAKKNEDKQIENFKYKPHDGEHNLESVHPSKIVGAKGLLAFSTKTRKAVFLVAENEQGLSVRGTTVYGWNENKSMMKTLRRPNDQLPGLRQGNFKRVDVILRENIKGKNHEATGRFNEEMVILKVF